jgi:hypothetical protein
MTTYYIDPDAITSGDGAEITPFNSWDDVTWAADNSYLQKRGTTFDGPVAPDTGGGASTPIYIGAYGTGAKPILNCPVDADWAFRVEYNKRYITIENFKFTGGQPGTYGVVSVGNGRDFTIKNCDFRDITSNHALYIKSYDEFTHGNIEVDSCTFYDMPAVSGVSSYQFGYPTDNIWVHDCTFDNVHKAIRSWVSQDNAGDGSGRPVGLIIEDNLITNSATAAVGLIAGLKIDTSNISYIRRNRILNTGTPTQPNVNCLQLHWVDGCIIENNFIDTVETSLPDGDGIIIDFNWSDPTYDSNYNIVRYNYVTGCNAGTSSAGVCNYRGSNNQIYYNILVGNSVGIRNSSTYSANNLFYNNVLVGNLYGARLDGSEGDASPETTFINNIIANNTSTGIRIVWSATEPTESYNCFYGNGEYDIYDVSGAAEVTIDATSITNNPLLKFDYSLYEGSSCYQTGVRVTTLHNLNTFKGDYNGDPVAPYDLINIGAFNIDRPNQGTILK